MKGGPVIPMPRRPDLSRLSQLPGWGILVVLLLLWMGSGFYQVGAAEAGVVRRFGKVTEITGPGLHWRLPWPIERHDTPDVAVTRRVEVGFRTVRPAPQAQYQSLPEEALMLTGDENIVHAEVAVQYQIRDPKKFLFRSRDPDVLVRAGLEAALRAVVGRRNIDDVLTTGKTEIQTEALALLQALLDRYDTGISAMVMQLQDVQPPSQASEAFKSVASAREEKQRLINESQAYQNDVIPKARGEVEKTLREAEAYKAEQEAQAKGEASRFSAMLRAYQEGKEINRTRLYLETMEQVLQGSEVYIVDQKSGGVLPLLSLTPAASASGGASGGGVAGSSGGGSGR